MIIQTLIAGFLVSYIGSIPPGTINISVMQLSMMERRRAALFMSIAAVLVEFLYAGITVQFQILLTTNEQVGYYFRIISSATLIALGLWNLLSNATSATVSMRKRQTGRAGFLQGLVLGLLNPMSIPFWLVVTTQLENLNLIKVTGPSFWAYLVGLSIGTFCLLSTVSALGNKFTRISDNKFLVHKVPGIILLILGVYFLIKGFYIP